MKKWILNFFGLLITLTIGKIFIESIINVINHPTKENIIYSFIVNFISLIILIIMYMIDKTLMKDGLNTLNSLLNLFNNKEKDN